MPLNLEKIKAYLKKLENIPEEEKLRRKAEEEEDTRMKQLFWESQEIAEEEERKIMEGKPSGDLGLPAKQIVP